MRGIKHPLLVMGVTRFQKSTWDERYYVAISGKYNRTKQKEKHYCVFCWKNYSVYLMWMEGRVDEFGQKFRIRKCLGKPFIEIILGQVASLWIERYHAYLLMERGKVSEMEMEAIKMLLNWFRFFLQCWQWLVIFEPLSVLVRCLWSCPWSTTDSTNLLPLSVFRCFVH